jgi:cob(I)alamin adenosyltransferase
MGASALTTTTEEDKSRDLIEAIEKELQGCVERNQIDLYLLGQKLFFHKDPSVRAAAVKELEQRIAELESFD